MAFKIKYEVSPYPHTGPGSKWVVIQELVIQYGHVITWKEPDTVQNYDFICKESNNGWSIERAQVRKATLKEIQQYELTRTSVLQ